MGSGKWSTNVYDEHERFLSASGKGAFDYSDGMHRAGRSSWRVHDTLNPWKVKVRESRDSDEHPDSTAIAVMFDVTGSMGSIPVTLQKKLPELLGLALAQGLCPGPADPVRGESAMRPVTGSRCRSGSSSPTTAWTKIWKISSSRAVAAASAPNPTSWRCISSPATRTSTAGPSTAARVTCSSSATRWPTTRSITARSGAVIGDGLQQDIPTAAIVKELRERYHVFYILPQGASYGGDATILGFWRKLLGQNVLELEDPEAVCETIALAIGMTEGTIDLKAGTADLRDYRRRRPDSGCGDHRTGQHPRRAW